MMKIIYGQDGFVRRVITGASSDFDISDHLQDGEAAIDGVAEPGTDKVIDGILVSASARPSNFHTFDKPSFSWVLNLDAAKTNAKNRITMARDLSEKSGFSAYGKMFDSNAQSIERIFGGVNAANAIGSSFTIDWTTADNSTITLDYAQMLALPVFMTAAADQLHQKSRLLKAQIDSATTLEEIDLITWETI